MASSALPTALRLGEIVSALESESESSDGEYLFDSEEESGDEDSEASEDSDNEPLSRKRDRTGLRIGRPNQPAALWTEGDFSPTLFPFSGISSGINAATNITPNSTELDIFKVFFTEDLVEKVVCESNRFYVQLSANDLKAKSRLHRWQDTSVSEMYVFFATVMLMSLQRKLKIVDYWSTDVLISSPMFSKIMPCDRFLLLLRMLHFSDNEKQVPGDKLYKVRPIIEALKTSFAKTFSPYQRLVIDESLMLWKGRLSFKQYIPSKRHRFGIKLFVLCDCETGYILDYIIYTGSTTEHVDATTLEEGIGKSGAVVLTLMQPYLNKGHILFTDNWYTSPALSEKLHKEKTGTCGTVKSNRKGMPVFSSKMKKGDLFELHKQELLAIKWHDKRDVHMLSTVHATGKVSTGKKDRVTGVDIEKPKCVVTYNKNMGAIDKTDMQLSFAECLRKSVKWYKKFFFHLLDLASLNAYVLFKTLHPEKKIQFGEFRLSLVRQTLQEYHQPRKTPKGGRTSLAQNPLRLTERHFPAVVPATEKKKGATRMCVVCSKTNLRQRKRKETRYMCTHCNVGLCVHPCFGIFHTETTF